ncbi:MAG: rod shape-determining protein RodA [Candidatus Parcubacteria bacterium]|nr:MAG: rod shape-determining protein RodA [Candidatus Parcubacteria bacterium]
MNQSLIILILLNLMVISLTALFALDRLDLFYKQYLFWLIGFFLFFSFLFVDYRFLFEKYFSYIIIFLSFLILILVLFTPGHLKSWFNIFGFSFQPAEFSKIGFFLLLVNFLSKYQLDLINPIYLIYSSITLIPYLILILLQPDWGMAFLYFLIWLLVIISYLSKKEILLGSVILILIFFLLWFFVLKEYQKERILVFVNPDTDPLKSGYNLRQIKLSLGTSSFFGKGIGLGEIGRLGFLPSAPTDFILTFLIEERGIFIFIIYSLLIFLLIYELIKAQNFHKNPLTKNFLFVISQYFLAKYLLTTLVNFGIFPIIGLPVPFLSYGGSYLVFDLWLLGILQGLTRDRV